MAKLTELQKIEIRTKFATGDYTKAGLARDYNSSSRTIGRVVDFVELEAKVEVEDKVWVPKVGDLITGKAGLAEYCITDSCSVCRIDELTVGDGVNVTVISTTNVAYQHRVGCSFNVHLRHFELVGHVEAVEAVEEEVEVEDEVTYNITQGAIALNVNGESYVIDFTHPNFNACKIAIASEDYNKAVDLMNVSKAITGWSEGKLTIAHGEVFFEGQTIQGKLVDKIINLMGEGEEGFKPFARFLERVLDNPSFKARMRLMEFAAASDIGIHEDGRLIAFKNVNEDGCSSRGGKWVQDDAGKWSHDLSQRYYHAVGEVLTMPRHEVDDQEDNTCSTGLHVCSAHYLKAMWGTRGKTFKVAVCPSDIVAIPPDYNNSKARSCRYEVIEDVSGTVIEDVLSDL